MKINRKWKEVFSWFCLLSVLFALVGFTLAQRAEVNCIAIEINVDESNSQFFVSKEDVEKKIYTVHEKVINEKLNKLSVHEIEAAVASLPEVKIAQAYLTIEGKLVLNIKQRRPIVRVMPARGSGFYIDEDGKYMPLSKNYAARVLVVNGQITQRYINISMSQLLENDSLSQQTLFDEIYQLASYIDTHTLWKAQIQQAYVDENQEFTLIPRVGSHNIGLGNTADLAKKFRKLLIFYKEGMPYTNWNLYETINLKFDNQVVCTKKTMPL